MNEYLEYIDKQSDSGPWPTAGVCRAMLPSWVNAEVGPPWSDYVQDSASC